MSDFEDAPQGSSIAAPLIRALLAAAVAFGVYWLVFGQVDPAEEMALDDPSPSVADVAPTVPAEPTPTAPPLVEPTTPPVIEATTPPAGQVGEGVSVQVLNGTDDQALFDDVVATLVELGYDVTEAGRARTDYDQTTIFATAGQEAQADALQQADPRFTVIGENPGNLTTELDIHVVVGSDWSTDGSADGSAAGAGTAEDTGPTEGAEASEAPEPDSTEG